MRSITAVAAAVAATAPFVSRPAAAQPNEEVVRLEYHAPPACTDEAQFFAQARARAPQMRLARPDERARVFIVEIEQHAALTSARLTVRDPDGQTTVRNVETKDCSEAVDALALVAALAVNPRAGARPKETPVPSDGTMPLPPGPTPPASPRAAPAHALARAPSPWTWRAGAAGFGVGAIAPEPLLGARVSAELVHLTSHGMAPSFRVSLGYATHNGFVVEGGTAHFAYAGANAEMCPLRLPPAKNLVFRPCVMADFGFVVARGSETLNPRSAVRPWADIGTGARLAWMLGGDIGVELDVGCMFPISRDRFLFGTDSFHRVAWVGGLAALGFLIRIP
jgi:hypothetical protein